MFFDVDVDFARVHIIQFAQLLHSSEKTEYVLKELVKVGSILVAIREWYDIHNRSRKFAETWKKIEKVFEDNGVDPAKVSLYVHQASNELMIREPGLSPDKKAVRGLAEFVNPLGMDKEYKEGFLKELVFKTPRTIQQAICSLVFSLIKAWAVYPGEDRRNKILRERCAAIHNHMVSQYGVNWDSFPFV